MLSIPLLNFIWIFSNYAAMSFLDYLHKVTFIKYRNRNDLNTVG